MAEILGIKSTPRVDEKALKSKGKIKFSD